MMIRKILATSILGIMQVTSINSYAVNLHEALSSAYNNNEQIKILQENFKQQVEALPIAISQGFVPNVSASFNHAFDKGKGPSNNPLTPGIEDHDKKQFSKSISLNQNLFSGGASVSNLAAAKYKVQSAKMDFYSKEQQLILDLIDIYFKTISSHEAFEAAKAFVNVAQKQYDVTTERVKLGDATKTDLALAQSILAQARYEEYSKRSEYETFKSHFKDKFYLDPIELKFPEIPSNLPKDFEIFKTISTSKNYDLQKVMFDQKSDKYELSASKGSLAPSVDFSASYTKKTAYQAESKSAGIQTGISVNIPIIPSGNSTYAKIRQQKSKLRNSVSMVELKRRETETKILSDWEKFNSQKLMLESTEILVKAKALEYEGKKASFDVGAENISNLLTAQKELFEARQKLAESRKEYFKSIYIILSDMTELTAEKLKLNANYFNPEKEIQRSKFRIIGY